jgi:LysR family glycine cleavage system transcriptional activator
MRDFHANRLPASTPADPARHGCGGSHAQFHPGRGGTGLTQTAISHQIAQLEAWLGTSLFVRSRKGVELTVLAEQAIPGIVEALAALEAALEDARPGVKSEQLSISTTPEFASQWLQPRLGGFCAVHPEIDVSVTIEYRRARLDIDKIGIAIWLAGTLPGADAYRLTDDYEFAVSSPAVARALPRRQALRAAPLLRYEGARHTVLDWERWHGQIYDRKERLPRSMARTSLSISRPGQAFRPSPI